MNEEIAQLLDREQLQLATTQKRAFAFVIDEVLISFLLVIMVWDAFSAAKTLEEMIYVSNAFVLEFFAVKIAYQTFFTMQYGATLGKMVMKIRVVEIATLDNPTIICALNRGVFRVVSEILMYLGFVWGMLDPARQTWHDKTARTLVVDV